MGEDGNPTTKNGGRSPAVIRITYPPVADLRRASGQNTTAVAKIDNKSMRSFKT